MVLSEESKVMIVDFLREELNPQLIYLYGTYAHGRGRVDSDVDLGIYTDKQVDPYDLFLLANQLATRLKRDVDLVNLKSASTVFRAQVVSSGEVLHAVDNTIKDAYEMRVYKEYAKLNEERQTILTRIREEGTVYGL